MSTLRIIHYQNAVDIVVTGPTSRKTFLFLTREQVSTLITELQLFEAKLEIDEDSIASIGQEPEWDSSPDTQRDATCSCRLAYPPGYCPNCDV